MKDTYQLVPYKDYELERISLCIGIKQTNIRMAGILVRGFLSVEAAKRWVDERKSLKC